MDIKERIAEYSIRHYKLITIVMVVFTLGLGAFIPLIKVDTDPENMLSEDEPVRVFHDETKERFDLYDMVVVGVVNEDDPNGVFNAKSLGNIYELTQFAEKELQWPDPDDPNNRIGVVDNDIMAPSTVDHIGQGGPGVVTFEWLMSQPPETDAEAIAIRDKALSNPLLKDTVVSGDGKALCIYLPLTSKDMSHRVYQALQERIAAFEGQEQYHITGLPVAEDTFGYEMFIQMAISAPLAMATIFILMLLFFRKLVLIISPMIIAMVAVISTMGLLIGLGYPVHIMSSMIPIFLMPIAVVDSVHILSEFFDLYTKEKGRKGTIREVMHNLFMPMLYTSLTSAAGFASLALTPIPPVQVFGVFVAVGIMIAWIATILFVPAYVMMVPDKSLKNFGLAAQHGEKQTWLSRILRSGGRLTYTRAKPLLAVFLLVIVVAVYGITRIQINDNPVKWFTKGHPIRVADRVLNEHFGGTYMAYLVLDPNVSEEVTPEYVAGLKNDMQAEATRLEQDFPNIKDVLPEAETQISELALEHKTKEALLDAMTVYAEDQFATAEEKYADAWYELSSFFGLAKEQLKVFKRPDVLRYIADLQSHLEDPTITGSAGDNQQSNPQEEKTGSGGGERLVGKSNSVSDVVKKVHQELIDGKAENYRIPDTSQAVAQCLLQFQSSHNPDDLWHFVTQDYMHANLWLQLTSGDNKQMQKVVDAAGRYFAENEPPVSLDYHWAGLTYINVVWQDKMVWGMLQSFLGSFVIVFVMMSVLFRSALWGLICMVPLTITIGTIYGIIGLVGKDYDMPVAVLSALTLGMAVDFAIHFLERSRAEFAKHGSWEKAAPEMFGEPARAISRNVLVIAIGFLPLLAAPLVPYKTVGIFLCAIMALSGIVTLLVLPAIIRLGENRLFKAIRQPVRPSCNCIFCLVVSAAAVLLVVVNIRQFVAVGWNKLLWVSAIAIPLMTLACGAMSRREACKLTEEEGAESESQRVQEEGGAS